ncbi:hypothetical protein GJU39_05175 [Pedobacter petrophilus]|uniref:Uncharacterized protein n=1 Tax=Pedobacter petrophilus TaxID=1908241 RepID=A0A7K0FXK8_9SPHI|nr:hypothetical protein [Pedobacter petrophilus]MRX75476.1 hypothetical protein [Pedobacter petrophilus]
MSKITIVEGDLMEFTGGNDLSYAKKEIINSGSEVVQVGKENGVSYGTNKAAPHIEFDTGIDVIVEFEPLSGYDGEFGFDWLRCDDAGSILKIQTVDVSNLEYVFDDSKLEYTAVATAPVLKDKIKREYEKIPLKLPYYAPWLSVLPKQGQIKINMLCKPVTTGEDVSKSTISFRKNDFYQVTIDGQTNENIKYKPDGNPKEITINCLKPAPNTNILAFDENNKVIGQIIAKDNTKTYKLPIRLVCVVKDSSTKETEITKLISDFGTNGIEDYLNKNSLNQAQIEVSVEVDSKYRIAFDENLWNGTFYNRAGNYFTNRKDPAGGKVKYINDDGEEQENAEYEHILDKFLRDYKTAFEADGKKFKGILLFITNINKDPHDQEGGVSRTMPVNFREAIVFGSNLKDKSSYAHEIAHALGLEHYFWRDAKYRIDLEKLKTGLTSNRAITADNKRIQKNNEEALKANKSNIKIRQQEIDKWTIEKKKPTYPYKTEAEARIKVLESENEKTRTINKDIQKKIDDGEDNIKKGEKHIKQTENNIKVYKNNRYKFKEKSTLNIMDYSSKVNIYTKWQWQLMQDDVKSYYGSSIENNKI